MNTVILDGKIMYDLELKETKKGIAWTTFLLDTSIPMKEGKRRSVKVRCVAFDKCAKSLAKQFKKEDKILIRGRLSVKMMVSEEGHKKRFLEIIIREYEKPEA